MPIVSALFRFPFCRAHGCIQQTDTQTDIHTDSATSVTIDHVLMLYFICYDIITVAPPGGGGKLPPYGWTSKNYVICMCFHCHGTSS